MFRINGELVSPTEGLLNALMLLYADDLVLLALDSQSLEAALLVLDQVARSGHSGVVVTPPAAATQGICRDYSRPPRDPDGSQQVNPVGGDPRPL